MYMHSACAYVSVLLHLSEILCWSMVNDIEMVLFINAFYCMQLRKLHKKADAAEALQNIEDQWRWGWLFRM